MAPKFVQGQDGWHHAVSQVQATLVLRPSDHLNLTKHDPCQIHTALRTQAALAPADASKFMVRVDKSKNLAFLLCLDSHVTQPLQEITSVDLDDRRCGVTIYPATPSNTCKGVIHNIPAGTSPEYLMRHMSTLRPEFKILAARMMGRTTTALITFHGTHIPHEICYAGGIFRCRPHRPKAQYCHRCQQIGHRIDVCTYNARCPTCGQLKPDDDSHTCSADPVCLRCGGPHRADDAACKDKQAADAAVRQLAYNKRIAQRKAALKAEGVAAAASATAPPKAPSRSRSRSRTRFTTPSRRRTSSSPRRTHNSSGRSPAGTRGHSPTAHQTPSRLPSHQVSQPLPHTPEHARRSPSLTYRDILSNQPSVPLHTPPPPSPLPSPANTSLPHPSPSPGVKRSRLSDQETSPSPAHTLSNADQYVGLSNRLEEYAQKFDAAISHLQQQITHQLSLLHEQQAIVQQKHQENTDLLAHFSAELDRRFQEQTEHFKSLFATFLSQIPSTHPLPPGSPPV